MHYFRYPDSGAHFATLLCNLIPLLDSSLIQPISSLKWSRSCSRKTNFSLRIFSLSRLYKLLFCEWLCLLLEAVTFFEQKLQLLLIPGDLIYKCSPFLFQKMDNLFFYSMEAFRLAISLLNPLFYSCISFDFLLKERYPSNVLSTCSSNSLLGSSSEAIVSWISRLLAGF